MRAKPLYTINDLSIKPIGEVKLSDMHSTNKKARVSFFLPKREEVEAILHLAELISGVDKPLILDIGCGNGFLAYLLAKEGDVDVIGIDPNHNLIEEASKHYKLPNLQLISGDSKFAMKYKGEADLVINSWMPVGIDLSKDIKKLNPKAIVYVRYKDSKTMTGKQYGLFQSYRTGWQYRNFLIWRTLGNNVVQIQLRHDVDIDELPKTHTKKKYNWEK